MFATRPVSRSLAALHASRGLFRLSTAWNHGVQGSLVLQPGALRRTGASGFSCATHELFVAADEVTTPSNEERGTSGLGSGPSSSPVGNVPLSVSEKPVVTVTPTRDLTANEHINTVSMKPQEIVAELDKYIIGQPDAKRAVAIALRNRWRRMQLSPELRQEIIPKNILMIGPTGVGKTEIARRLAKIAKAPFVKVEATKYTEVGYHGKDVDTIIRDLLEASMQLTRQLKVEQFREEIRPTVERRIIEALTGPDAREDSVAMFRQMLKDGELDDREIYVEVPVREANAGGGQFAVDVSGTSIDFTDLFGKLGMGGGGGGGGSKRAKIERKRVKIRDSWALLEDAEIDKKLDKIDMKKEAIELAEQSGIVVIDEIDKIVSDKKKYGGDASAEGVQRDLLPLIEGTQIEVKRFGQIKTDYILFIASGAFHEVKPSDMLAELQGRLPIRVELKALEVGDLRRILTEPKANIIEQQKKLIEADGVKIEFTEGAITKIAELAFTVNKTIENIGARRLYTVVEKIMEDISFTAPEMAVGNVVTIDEALVTSKLAPMMKKDDLSKFIL